ncbi:MAG: hypothetical protein HY860_03115 [Chlamydiales bacterium]|nr:hypothetical protein [Chlamydiales bacterium]
MKEWTELKRPFTEKTPLSITFREAIQFMIGCINESSSDRGDGQRLYHEASDERVSFISNILYREQDIKHGDSEILLLMAIAQLLKQEGLVYDFWKYGSNSFVRI